MVFIVDKNVNIVNVMRLFDALYTLALKGERGAVVNGVDLAIEWELDVRV